MLDGLDLHALARLARVAADVRGQEHIVELGERAAIGLGVEGVEVGACLGVLAEELRERRLVDEPAARAIDHHRVRSEHGDARRVQQVLRVGGEAQIEGDDVARAHQLVDGAGPDAVLVREGGVEHGIAREQADREGLQQPNQGTADAAEANDAHRLAAQEPAHRLLPLAAADGAVGGAQVSQHRERAAEHQLGDGVDVRLGRVEDRNAARARRP